MGYGTRALELLEAYYSLKFVSLDEAEAPRPSSRKKAAAAAAAAGATLATEQLVPRADVPSLLQKLAQRQAERLHYVGTSFGITESLYGFWQRSGYVPLYVRQTTNDLTGEHTAIVVKTLGNFGAQGWLPLFHAGTSEIKSCCVCVLSGLTGLEISRGGL
jgi:N-acetyltransferase 10